MRVRGDKGGERPDGEGAVRGEAACVGTEEDHALGGTQGVKTTDLSTGSAHCKNHVLFWSYLGPGIQDSFQKNFYSVLNLGKTPFKSQYSTYIFSYNFVVVYLYNLYGYDQINSSS